MKTILFLVLFFCVQRSAQASAVLEWTLLRFVNSGGKDSSGRGCDIFNSCDHFFDFSVETDSSVVWSRRSGVFWDQDVNDFPTGTINGGISNPVTVSFLKWPSGAVYLKVNVYDSDADFSNGDDHVGSLISTLYAQPDPSADNSYPTQTSISNSGKSFFFQYRVYCSVNYYGNDCSKLCIPRDDNLNGHYRCSRNGDIVCLAGWENEASLCLDWQDDCRNNNCQNGAKCLDAVRSYSCVCQRGFEGVFCENQRDDCSSSPCDNGGDCVDKTDDFVCNCKTGFVGKTCSETACKNTSLCQNNGTCYGNLKCMCSDLFYGEYCSEQLCKKTGCKNGGVCSVQGRCQCPKGVTGSTCETVLCDIMGDFCKNGGQCIEGECVCPIHLSGLLCERDVVCENYPCKNNGTCESSYDLEAKKFVPSCKCKSGFSGEVCQNMPNKNTETVKQDEQIKTIENNPLCDTQSKIAYIILGIIIFLLLIVTIVLAILLCRKRTQFRKRPLDSVLSSSPSVFSSDESGRTFSASTMRSSVSAVHSESGTVNGGVFGKKSTSGLSLGSVKNTALPNVYDGDKEEEKWEKELENEYEDLKDKVVVGHVREDNLLNASSF